MGTLRELATGRIVHLGSRAQIGRAAGVSLRIRDRMVSSEHAVLWWNGQHWALRDLASRNGTFVDGTQLASGDTRVLDSGARLGFGSPEASHELLDAGPPRAVATDEGGDQRIAEGGMLCLPSEDAPVVVVFRDSMGTWQAEGPAGVRAVESGDEVEVEGTYWELALPLDEAETWAREAGAIEMRFLPLDFSVSSDEEHVQVVAGLPTGTVELEPRAHHYLLLTLARRHVDDAEMPEAERGWLHVDELERMLRIARGSLNMQIMRARREMEGLGIADPMSVIERRPLVGTLRLGTPRVRVGRM